MTVASDQKIINCMTDSAKPLWLQALKLLSFSWIHLASPAFQFMLIEQLRELVFRHFCLILLLLH
jgi:hypothetical protein